MACLLPAAGLRQAPHLLVGMPQCVGAGGGVTMCIGERNTERAGASVASAKLQNVRTTFRRILTCDAGGVDCDGLRCCWVVGVPLQTSGAAGQHAIHTNFAAIAGPDCSLAEQRGTHAPALHTSCTLPGSASARELQAAINGALAHGLAPAITSGLAQLMMSEARE